MVMPSGISNALEPILAASVKGEDGPIGHSAGGCAVIVGDAGSGLGPWSRRSQGHSPRR